MARSSGCAGVTSTSRRFSGYVQAATFGWTRHQVSPAVQRPLLCAATRRPAFRRAVTGGRRSAQLSATTGVGPRRDGRGSVVGPLGKSVPIGPVPICRRTRQAQQHHRSGSPWRGVIVRRRRWSAQLLRVGVGPRSRCVYPRPMAMPEPGDHTPAHSSPMSASVGG